MELVKYLQEDPSHVTLDWLLELVQRKIERTDQSKEAVYIVDIIPNMKLFLRHQSLVKDCQSQMEKFESRVSFLPVHYFRMQWYTHIHII